MSKKHDDTKEKPSAPQSAAAPIEAKSAAPQTATLRYIDRPDCAETFADSINNLNYDGQSLRIEFGVKLRLHSGSNPSPRKRGDGSSSIDELLAYEKLRLRAAGVKPNSADIRINVSDCRFRIAT